MCRALKRDESIKLNSFRKPYGILTKFRAESVQRLLEAHHPGKQATEVEGKEGFLKSFYQDSRATKI